MNSKLFSISIFMLVMTQGSLFSMRSITSKTGSKAAQSVAAIGGASRVSYTQSLPAKDMTVLSKVFDPKNQQKSESGSQGQDNPKAKWYKKKSFKYPAAGVALAGGVAGLSTIDAQQQEKFAKNERILKEIASKKREAKEEIWAGTDDVATVDSDLYKVILRIKKDIGISNDVPVRIAKKGFAPKYFGEKASSSANAYYSTTADAIVLKGNYRTWSKSYLIHVLIHEFEHYRQYHKYHGSYGSVFRPKDLLKIETGADAASAGYFDCPECLRVVQSEKHIHEPHETEEGCFSTPNGYFSKQDYQPYIDRAQCEGEACRAHREVSFWHLLKQKNKTSLIYYLPKESL